MPKPKRYTVLVEVTVEAGNIETAKAKLSMELNQLSDEVEWVVLSKGNEEVYQSV